VRLVDNAYLRTAEGQFRTDFDRFAYRTIEARRLEDVTEPSPEPLEHVGSAIEWDRLAQGLRDCPQFVDAMAMVGMIVGDDHAIDRRNLRLEQLLADVGPTVDKEPAAPTLEKDR
jgi:hypothetical protein